MNDYDLQNVLNDVKDYYYIMEFELRFVYKLNGNYLWVYNGLGIVKGCKNFSLRNLDKLLKFLKNERIKFTDFEIQN